MFPVLCVFACARGLILARPLRWNSGLFLGFSARERVQSHAFLARLLHEVGQGFPGLGASLEPKDDSYTPAPYFLGVQDQAFPVLADVPGCDALDFHCYIPIV
jgi:hypothetical protein